MTRRAKIGLVIVVLGVAGAVEQERLRLDCLSL